VQAIVLSNLAALIIHVCFVLVQCHFYTDSYYQCWGQLQNTVLTSWSMRLPVVDWFVIVTADLVSSTKFSYMEPG